MFLDIQEKEESLGCIVLQMLGVFMWAFFWGVVGGGCLDCVSVHMKKKNYVDRRCELVALLI